MSNNETRLQTIAETRVPLNVEGFIFVDRADKWQMRYSRDVEIRPIYPCHLCDDPCPNYVGGGSAWYCNGTECDRFDMERLKLMVRQSHECDPACEPDIGDVVTVEFTDGRSEDATIVKELVGYLAGYYRAQAADGRTIIYTGHPIT
jgi:hypothetical protein